MKQIKKSVVLAVFILSLLLSSAFAMSESQIVDVYEVSEVGADPRWTYINHINNGLGIDQYNVTVSASTIAYGMNHAYVTAVLQQKQANGSYKDYIEFSDDGVAAAAVSERVTVPYGTYRIVSYHSAGNGDDMEYKTLIGPNKRVPHDSGQ